MATVTGYIEKIKYRNEENGYSVLSVSEDGEEYIIVGNFNYIDEGSYIEATGNMKIHPVYGEQLLVDTYEIKSPEDMVSIERYLSSGAIKGVGAALAKRIVKKFKADTLRVMEEEPERLSEIKGISERIAMEISGQVQEKKDMREAMMYLQKLGISMNLAVKIYKQYGPAMYGIIKDNPYKLADDISGVGFKVADDIASKSGIVADSGFRIKCALNYVLTLAAGQGHMYLPEEELIERASQVLDVDQMIVKEQLSDMQMEKRIIIKNNFQSTDSSSDTERNIIYPAKNYYVELNTAKLLCDLNVKAVVDRSKVEQKIKDIEHALDIELDETQSDAVIKTVENGLMIITGGPGTGKTTTINAIIRYFEESGKEILLAAPTGRAAKRMAEATGHEAKTIHRLLEITGAPSDDKLMGMSDMGNQSSTSMEGMHFQRNEEFPLDADVVIIDEMSMVDIYLMFALLKAVSIGTRLILVGDINQLPSVGPGHVLKDMIDSGCFDVVRLNKIYRQAAESDIVVDAHKMIDEEPIDLSKRSNDFLFIKRLQPDAIISAIITLVKDKLPNYVDAYESDIQVLTPMRRGPLGVERLNAVLQQALNPHDRQKNEKEIGTVTYREGDKVMQVKNNYQAQWEIRNSLGMAVEHGTGIYNGDIGIIREIDTYAEIISVEFDENRIVEYQYSDADQLELAYAITIHKSQGSEYPAVIIPVYSGPKMLLTRNLIYTAVTRAKSCVALVGVPEYFYDMVGNTTEMRRYSGLGERIHELNSD